MVSSKAKYSLTLLACLAITSCSLLDTHQLNESIEQVRLFDDYEQVKDCRYIDEIVSSEGRWYNFLFISNKELTHGSINDLKNQAHAIGANTIHVHYNLTFNTSVTFLGQAYYCNK